LPSRSPSPQSSVNTHAPSHRSLPHCPRLSAISAPSDRHIRSSPPAPIAATFHQPRTRVLRYAEAHPLLSTEGQRPGRPHLHLPPHP
jgi:hypothetical protein